MQNYNEFSRKNLVVIIIFCLFLGCSDKTESQYNELAINYLSRGHYDDAISALRKAIKLNPSSADAHFNLGRAYNKKEMDEKAKAEFNISYRISPEKFDECVRRCNEEIDYGIEFQVNDTQYLIELGNAYKEKGMLNEAIDTYQKVLKMEPENVQVHYDLGMAYSNKGLYKKAVSELKSTIEIDQNMPEAHYNLGMVYYKQDKMDMAISEYKLTLNLLPETRERKRASVHYKLGLAYNDNGMSEHAINELQRAIEITPNDTKIHYQLSKVYKENGMFGKAEKELEIYNKFKKQKL